MHFIRRLWLGLLKSRNPIIRRTVRWLWWDKIILGIGRLGLVDWKLLGDISTNLGKIDLTLQSHQQALVRYPESATAHFQVGAALMELGKYKESAEFFGEALARNPRWFGAYEVYGRSLWICGQYDEAARAWASGLLEQHKQAELHGLGDVDYRVLDARWTKWLGNNAHLDAYIKLSILGLSSKKKIKVLARDEDIANPTYLNYWRHHVELISSNEIIEKNALEVTYRGDPLHVFYTKQAPVFYYYAMGLAQAEWETSGRPPLLELSDFDAMRGRDRLGILGIPDGAWYVCLHVRESGYWDEDADPTNKPRNADISTYRMAIEYIVAAGGWVIRMGDASMRPMPAMKGVVDYAGSKLKSDWMDVFLCASCRFFLGTNSALYHVCVSFGVPSVLTNWIPVASHPLQSRDIFIPKLLSVPTENRLLSFDEMMNPPRDIWSGRYFMQKGLSVIDNTAEEILDLVREKMALLDTEEVAQSNEDVALQSRYRALAKSKNILANAKIGSAFLKKYQGLLKS